MDIILRDNEVIKYLNLWAQRSGVRVDQKSFELGRMSVALMLESQARIFESLEGTSLYALNKTEIAVALRTLLRSLKIDDDALDCYESVCVMKVADVTTFEPTLQHGQLSSPVEDPARKGAPSQLRDGSRPEHTPASSSSGEELPLPIWPATAEEKAAYAAARRHLESRTDDQDSPDESERSPT